MAFRVVLALDADVPFTVCMQQFLWLCVCVWCVVDG